ncbi:hypothetical protein RIF29_21046 [Crotalaria pallida]|uniref:DUF4283 domain-containing protein n=1 Tax=Crotalaria pallida TaxID=3830 RepID=A0AAN9F6M2_CROPI
MSEKGDRTETQDIHSRERRLWFREGYKHHEEEGWTLVKKGQKRVRDRKYEAQYEGRQGAGSDAEKLRVVQGTTNLENTAWLNRSLIVETKKPFNRKDLLLLMVNPWPTICMIRDLGSFKFIVTFRSYDDREEALKKDYEEAMVNYIRRVRKWTPDVICERRRVWLEIFGIPPHAWNKENFEHITDRIGTIVELDPDTEEGLSMESAKIIRSRVSDTGSQHRNMVLTPAAKNTEVEGKEEEDGPALKNMEAEQILHGKENDDDGGQMVLEGNNKEVNEDCLDSQKTAIGNIAFNLEEEIALVAQYKQKGIESKAHNVEDSAQFLDMFVTSPSQSEYDRAYLGEEAQCGPNKNDYVNIKNSPNKEVVIAQCLNDQQDDKTENSSHQTQIRSKGKKKAAHKQQLSATTRITRKGKHHRSSYKDHEAKDNESKPEEAKQMEETSDDACDNEEDEARMTWEIGKELNLKAHNEDKIKDTIVLLRRSARKRGSSGKDGDR